MFSKMNQNNSYHKWRQDAGHQWLCGPHRINGQILWRYNNIKTIDNAVCDQEKSEAGKVLRGVTMGYYQIKLFLVAGWTRDVKYSFAEIPGPLPSVIPPTSVRNDVTLNDEYFAGLGDCCRCFVGLSVVYKAVEVNFYCWSFRCLQGS
ncbi:hypothetical protein Btru_064955 [Bulinus truncatus]|nr:hypothetical protein Btru_064955 [Bulinus truncatus]